VRIFFIFAGGLPNSKKIKNAAVLRNWQFFQSAKKLKAEIFFIEILENCSKNFQKTKCGKFSGFKINKNFFSKKLLQKVIDFNPDFLVGVNFIGSFLATRILENLSLKKQKKIIFWADLNGLVMTEIQAQARILRSNNFLPHFWQMEKKILSMADKISTVSNPGKFAVLGELASIGRLRFENFGHNFVEKIANCSEFFSKEKENFGQKISNSKIAKKLKLPAKKFLIGQIGGFNAWVDWEKMFSGVEIAMKKNDHIFFVTTGGKLKNIDEKSFINFYNAAQKSKFSDRFIFLGWVDNNEIPKIYRQIDCVINIDFDCAETFCGARNRLTESLKFGRAIISTIGSEIAQKIVETGAGISVKTEKDLAEKILQLAENKTLQKKMERNSKQLFDKFFKIGNNKEMENFELFLQNGQKAPKKNINLSTNFSSKIRAGVFFLKKRGIKQFLKRIFKL